MTLRVISGGRDKQKGRGSNSVSQTSNVKGIGTVDYVWPLNGMPHHRKRPVVLMRGGNVRDASDIVPVIDVWHYIAEQNGEVVQYALNPAYYLPDPTRPEGSFLVCCEVKTLDGRAAEINYRATLRATHNVLGGNQDSLDSLGSTWGFVQSYAVLSAKGEALSTAEAAQVFEYHLGACIDAGIMISAADPVAQGSPLWSFEISDRGFPEVLDPDPANPLIMADQLMLARHLLVKAAVDKGCTIALGGAMLLYSNQELRATGDPQPLLNLFGAGDEGVTVAPERQWDGTTRMFTPNRIAIGFEADPYLTAAKVLAAFKGPGR